MLPIQNPKVQSTIETLKSIDIDGETMQFIIEELSMQNQMIKQLIRTYPITATQELIYYKQEFPFNLTQRSINYPLTKAQELKLDIISNYIEYFTSDEMEREMMLDNAYFYVADDHANELDNLIK
jgi:hypothetical protein